MPGQKRNSQSRRYGREAIVAALLSFPRMIQAVHPFQVSDLDLQVLLRGIQRLMPEKLSDVGDINIAMQQMRRGGVSETVDRQVLLQFQ
jgi:hypothetical protein